MSLFEDNENTPETPPSKPVQVKIEAPEYDGITIDTQYVPSSAILLWGEGSLWTVDYYSQVLGKSNEPTAQDLDRDPIYQQYRLIKSMPLKVDGSLQFSQDDTVRYFEVTGNGYTYPFLTPNKGDMFIANIGDGRLGVFTITSAKRATILRDSVYNVEWSMVSELTAQRIEDFQKKVIETFYFSNTSLASGCGPFITTQDVGRNEEYQDIIQELTRRYLTDFFSPQHSTFLVPDQQLMTYDHFATKAMLQLISSLDDQRVRRVKTLNVGAERVMDQPTLWDAITRRDVSRMYGSTQRAHIVSTNHLRGRPVLQAIGFSGIPRMVFPIDAPTDVDSHYKGEDRFRPVGIAFTEGRPRRPLPGPFQTQQERNLPFFQIVPDDVQDIPAYKRPADIHPVVKDEYYVFSKAFYDKAQLGQSKLELLTNQYLNGESLNLEQLDVMLGRVYDWDNLERYYYYPVVIALLKTQLR